MEVLDPLTDPRWADLLDRAPAASIFHEPAWLRLTCGAYGYAVAAWALTGPDGRLTAGLPVARLKSRLTGSRLLALPFSDRCPPLFDPAAGADPAHFTRELDAERRRQDLPLEVRDELAPGQGAEPSRTFAWHRLALDPDVAVVRARFAKSQIRRGIAKAEREGVTIERSEDAAGLRRFYTLHDATRRRQGVPTPSKRYILRFADLFARGLGFVLLARQHGRDVAAAVFLSCRGTLTYEYGASDPRYLGSRPNNLLFMEAIRWACESGHHALDFGRTDLDNHGLLAFKRAWGAEETSLRYHRFGVGSAPGSDAGARDLLAVAIRRGPPGLGRLVGTALYRHLG